MSTHLTAHDRELIVQLVLERYRIRREIAALQEKVRGLSDAAIAQKFDCTPQRVSHVYAAWRQRQARKHKPKAGDQPRFLLSRLLPDGP